MSGHIPYENNKTHGVRFFYRNGNLTSLRYNAIKIYYINALFVHLFYRKKYSFSIFVKEMYKVFYLINVNCIVSK